MPTWLILCIQYFSLVVQGIKLGDGSTHSEQGLYTAISKQGDFPQTNLIKTIIHLSLARWSILSDV